MANRRLSKRQLEVRNKWIAAGLLILLVLVIYLIYRISVAVYEERMKDNRVTVEATYHEALKKQLKVEAVVSNGIAWSSADKKAIAKYMKPDRLYFDPEQKYQFLNLRMSQDLKAKNLDMLVKDQGVLDGLGKAFQQAGEDYDVNEIYLISHAMLETGKGTSQLARGVPLDKKGNYDPKGKLYFNFYGVSAFDRDPITAGAHYAQDHGWDTPAKAVLGGAKFIKEEYLDKDNQYTLYSMRFNPSDPGKHQYATDVMWAHHNAWQMAVYYKKLGMKGKYYTRHFYRDFPEEMKEDPAKKKDK